MEQKAKILVIDDDPNNLNALNRLLRQIATVIKVLNGANAISVIDSDDEIDLVLLDLNMPGLDGFEVLTHIKRSANHKETPVLILSGSDKVNDEEKALTLGACDFIHKPYTSSTLKLRIKNSLSTALMRKKLEDLAIYDYLSGLKNRLAFDKHFDISFKQSKRSNSQILVAIIDIDHFKLFNDTYGHPEGDRAIKAVADTMKSHFTRATDFVARYGGEEFCIICQGENLEKVAKRFQEILKRIENLRIQHRSSNSSSWLTASAGIAYGECTDISKDKLFELADQCLYTAKANGRNQLKLIYIS